MCRPIWIATPKIPHGGFILLLQKIINFNKIKKELKSRDKMHRFLFVLLLALLTLPSLASDRYGNNMECLHINRLGADQYYFCGEQYASCAGDKANSYDNRAFQTSGQYVKFSNKDWVCCGGTDSKEGVYKNLPKLDDGLTWSNKADHKVPYYNKSVTVDLDNGGKCTYFARFDGCGNELTKPCTEPTNCTDGYVLRNKTCVPPCEDGYDFESTTSNKCVECPTTLYQGSVVEGGTTYCKKCNKNTQFMDVTQNKCVLKSEYESIGHAVLAKCALCENNETAIQCVKCFSSDDANCKSSFSKSCLIY